MGSAEAGDSGRGEVQSEEALVLEQVPPKFYLAGDLDREGRKEWDQTPQVSEHLRLP